MPEIPTATNQITALSGEMPRPVRPRLADYRDQFMGALQGINPGDTLRNGGWRNLDFDKDMFLQAMDPYRQALAQWRIDKDAWKAAKREGGPHNGNPASGPVQTLPTPVGQPIPAPQQPNTIPGMVGQSLYVQGMTPAANGFSLPTY